MQPAGTLVPGVSKSRHILGPGGGPLDAVPGLPLPRHKASFLPLVPRLPRGAWGAGLEGGDRHDIPTLSPARPSEEGLGHKGSPGSPEPQIPLVRVPPPLNAGVSSLGPPSELACEQGRGEGKREET